MVIFKSKLKKLEGDLKIKLSGKRLYSTENVKYISGCKNWYKLCENMLVLKY